MVFFDKMRLLLSWDSRKYIHLCQVLAFALLGDSQVQAGRMIPRPQHFQHPVPNVFHKPFCRLSYLKRRVLGNGNISKDKNSSDQQITGALGTMLRVNERWSYAIRHSCGISLSTMLIPAVFSFYRICTSTVTLSNSPFRRNRQGVTTKTNLKAISLKLCFCVLWHTVLSLRVCAQQMYILS